MPVKNHEKHIAMRANLSEAGTVRREVFEGVDHMVVPVVMIVEGVLNGALVAADEFSRYAEAWNGRPVPVMHPEDSGTYISANSPDVLERMCIGHVFNVYADGQKLKGEAWVNVDKARRLGHGALVDALEAGKIVEVSTGYLADAEIAEGYHNGEPYAEIHRNIRPDHLALLPNEEGACSVRDGCGTRVNRKEKGMTNRVIEAIKTMAGAAGLRVNVETEGEMPNEILKKAEELKANEKLSAKQFQMVTEMDEEQIAMLATLVEAMKSAGPTAQEQDGTEEPEAQEVVSLDGEAPVTANQSAKASEGNPLTPSQMNQLIANRVDEALRRKAATDKLVGNSKCPFSGEDLKAMTVDHLEKLAMSLQPEDYSGAGGFAVNGSGSDVAEPLKINRGVLSRDNQEK